MEMYGKHGIHSHIHNPDLSTYSYIYTYRYVMKAKHTRTFKGRKEITGRGRGHNDKEVNVENRMICVCANTMSPIVLHINFYINFLN